MRRDITSPDDFLQDLLFDWLDESELAGEEANLSSVASLFGKLVRDGLFQYAKYVQRLVARGEPGLSYTQVCRPVLRRISSLIPTALWFQEIESRHRKFLRCIPLHHSTSSLVSQRKVTLHGARARETPEDLNEREIRKEIRAILPQLFGGG
jgi:mediator of RNA polymerase II transcription subunit 12